jgi:hypothetical protein
MTVENMNVINTGKERFMPRSKKGTPPQGIPSNLLERVRSTMQSRNESSEEIDDRVPRQRFHRIGRAARVAAEEVEQDYIRSLFRGTLQASQVPTPPEAPETSQE